MADTNRVNNNSLAESRSETSFANDVEINSHDDSYVTPTPSGGIWGYYSEDQIRKYVSAPMYYHKQLMHVSEKMLDVVGIYAETIYKMQAAPSLDYVIIPSENGSLKKRQKVLNRAYDIFDNKINHKMLSRDCIFNACLYGEYVAIMRDTKATNVERPTPYASGNHIEGSGFVDNMMLQPLDLGYTRFEGMANGDYVVSFDLQYFDQFRGDHLIGEIKNFPREFLVGYNAYKRDASKRWLLLDQKKTFAYKFHAAENESHGRMLGLQALNDMLFALDYRESQRGNLYDQSASVRYMELPEGERTGSCSLNVEQQRNQYEAFKRAVNRNDSMKRQRIGTTTTMKLAPGTKLGKLDMDNTFLTDTLTEQNNTDISTDLGLAIGALNATGDASYSALAVNIDLLLCEVFSMLEQISFQYTKLINNYLELKEDNMIEFVYLHTSTLNGAEQFNRYKDLYTIGGGSRTYLYSAACGDARTYMKIMDYEREQGYDNKYQPHITSYTASDRAEEENPDNNLGGRPQKDLSELTDSGIQTRTNGGNEMEKPSTEE